MSEFRVGDGRSYYRWDGINCKYVIVPDSRDGLSCEGYMMTEQEAAEATERMRLRVEMQRKAREAESVESLLT